MLGGSVGLFATLAWQVHADGALVDTDASVAATLHQSCTPSGVGWMSAVTACGEGGAQTAICLAVFALLLWRGRRDLALTWAIATAGMGILVPALKALFGRPRPTFPDPVAQAAGFSFPSGHAMGTFVIVATALHFAFAHVERRDVRVALLAAGAVWTVLMGATRLYLGVHYLSDVLAGFAAGAAWLMLAIGISERVLRRRRAAEL